MDRDHTSDILDLISAMKAKGQPFALATVVRTVSVTAAKAGAKAVIRPDGTVTEGWIGGGCARAAVVKAEKATEAYSDLIPIMKERRDRGLSLQAVADELTAEMARLEQGMGILGEIMPLGFEPGAVGERRLDLHEGIAPCPQNRMVEP